MIDNVFNIVYTISVMILIPTMTMGVIGVVIVLWKVIFEEFGQK